MAHRTESAVEARRNFRLGMRVAFYLLAFSALAVLGLLGFGRLEQHLIQSSRFIVAGPADYGEQSPNLKVRGIKNTSRDAVNAVFQGDFGRSLYLFPAAERRRNLLVIPWVREARVMRVWPNSVRADIVERVPVAFVAVPGAAGQPSRFAMIDGDGVLLQASGARFHLPVVVGMPLGAGIEARRDRIHRVQRLLKEFGPLVDRVSEIDAGEPDNLKVSVEMDRRAMVLELGNQHYALRFNGFLNYYPKIRDRLPNATAFDLRLEDRITAVGGSSSVQ
ncbi:MAG: FtsQ-type POTRA domain-containing protein [Bryobacterales bacterium]|nr:FtsQ-type POTRA domain-containing protein [Bryobacterales bacterium]